MANELTGRRFGNLLALRQNAGGWLCVCDCGREVTASEARLLSGEAVTCGGHKPMRVPERTGVPGKCPMCGETIDRAEMAYCSLACARMAQRLKLVRRMEELDG